MDDLSRAGNRPYRLWRLHRFSRRLPSLGPRDRRGVYSRRPYQRKGPQSNRQRSRSHVTGRYQLRGRRSYAARRHQAFACDPAAWPQLYDRQRRSRLAELAFSLSPGSSCRSCDQSRALPGWRPPAFCYVRGLALRDVCALHGLRCGLGFPRLCRRRRVSSGGPDQARRSGRLPGPCAVLYRAGAF